MPVREVSTSAGTFLVKDINPGMNNSTPEFIFKHENHIYFCASSPGTGPEPHRSDGTAAGTVLIKDVAPGGAGTAPQQWFAHNGLFFFRGFVGATGSELYQTNNTEAGTFMVQDLNPGMMGGTPFAGISIGEMALLRCTEGTDNELYRLCSTPLNPIATTTGDPFQSFLP